jgi:exosortase/archaeosortase family protein
LTSQFISRLRDFIIRHRLQYARDTLLFLVILFGFHFLYSALINEDLMIPGLEGLYVFLRKNLYDHSAWVVEYILGIGFDREGYIMYFNSGGAIEVDESCSAVKWFAHFMVLMLLFPGPWKHKLWFIPAGLLITHLVNIIRISGLAVVYSNNPASFDFYHDYVFRPFFYLVLFLMWVLWVEWFYLPRKKSLAIDN